MASEQGFLPVFWVSPPSMKLELGELWTETHLHFLGAFTELRKATLSFPFSVLQSAWNSSAPTGRIFIKFYIWYFFENLQKKIQVSLKSDKNNGHFTWIPINILMISRSVLLRMRNVSDKNCRENQNAHFAFSKLFYRLWVNVEKYGRTKQATDGNMAHFTLSPSN
jgi:hypothetical protein